MKTLPIWIRMPAAALSAAIALAVSPSIALAGNLGKARSAEEAVALWLEQDCEEVDLQGLLRFRESIMAALVAALEKGPSAQDRALVARLSEDSYEELRKQEQRKPERKVASTRTAYINRNVENFDAQYRVRAAQALAVLGSPEARAALEAALRELKREDVRATIEALLKKPK